MYCRSTFLIVHVEATPHIFLRVDVKNVYKRMNTVIEVPKFNIKPKLNDNSELKNEFERQLKVKLHYMILIK